MPSVSIITPAWNAVEYIEPAIESVRAQTFADWELIVVDDGSTDDTGGIVARHASVDPRIRLVSQPNAGVAAARNHALRLASGQFCLFFDSDDVLMPEFIARQMAVFERYPDTSLVTGNGLYLGGPFDGQPARPLVSGTPAVPLARIIADEQAMFIMTMFRRSVVERIGGFDESLRTNEDYDFFLRAAAAGLIVRRNPQPLAMYRVRPGSLSRDRVRMIRGMLVVYRKTRGLAVEGSPERGVLEAQIERFESELLLEEGKAALERGDYTTAAARLQALRSRGGGPLVAAAAWLAAHAPRFAAAAYHARRWRPRWLRGRIAARETRLDEAAV